MKKILLLFVLFFAVPAHAVTIWIPVSQASEDAPYDAVHTCAIPALTHGSNSSYWYSLCQDDTAWSGAMQWKFTSVVPWVHTGNVHFKVMYESLTENEADGQTVAFNVGGIANGDECNTLTDKAYCKISTSTSSEPPLTYDADGTDSGANSKCVGDTDGVGVNTNDGTACTQQSTCTSAGQACVSTVQVTALDSSAYTLQKSQIGSDTLGSCTSSSCSGLRVTYTLEVDAVDTTIDRDFRVLALGVVYDQ